MSGWTTITMEAQKAATKIKPLLGNHVGEHDHMVDPDDEGKIVVELGGYGRGEDGKKLIEDVKPEKAVLINANNTSDSGNGVYFERKDGEMIEVDTKEGYEGARANDVAGYFKDTYGFYGYTQYR